MRIVFCITLACWSVFLPWTATAQEPPHWSAGAPMPTPRKEVANAAVALDGEVYVLGGIDSSGTVSNAVEAYDPASDSWRSVAPLILPVWRGSAAVANGRIYVIGGYQAQAVTQFPFNPTKRVFEYNPAIDNWREVASMNTVRGSLASITINGEIHAIGGAFNDALSTHEIYDPATNEWRFAEPMSTTRSGLTAAALEGRLYAFGGYRLGNTGVQRRTSAEVFDPASGSWSPIARLPQARVGIDAVTHAGQIIVIGGGDTPGSRTIRYDPVTDSWSDLPDMPVPVNFMGVARVGTAVIAAGGGPVNLNRFDAVADTRVLTLAAEFSLNAGLNDAWFFPGTAGQGFFIIVFPGIKLVFMAWFTYDTERPDASVVAILGEPGHRWLTAQGPFAGDTAVLDIIQTSGGVFDTGQPAVVNETIGSIILEFGSCTAGSLTYDIPSIARAGEIAIQRIANDNVALCESLD